MPTIAKRQLPQDDVLSIDSVTKEDSATGEPDEPKVNTQKHHRRHYTNDLVRLYLQDIGRVPLLTRDQEIAQAQKLQCYLHLLTIRDQAKTDIVIKKLIELAELHTRLVSQSGGQPSKSKWATAANLSVDELNHALIEGKIRWAELAGIEVKELEKRQKEGIAAKNLLINANLRLVVSVAKKYQHRGLELLDLIQEGTLGLERAVEKFDPSKGYRFSTYAYWWIRQGMTRAIATFSRTIRIPIHITEKLNKIKKAQRKIAQKKGRIATIDDIAEELEISPDEVRETLLKVPRSVSLEMKVGNDKDTQLGDLIETASASPEEILMRDTLQQQLESMMSDLTDREREVIEMRYGLGSRKSSSLAHIARTLHISRERVRQIESKAMQKLRHPQKRKQIQDYLESLS